MSKYSATKTTAQKYASENLSLMTLHERNAQKLKQARAISAVDGTRTVWENPQALRICAEHQQLKDFYFTRFMTWTQIANRAQWRDYHHSQLVKQNAEKQKVVPVMSLRELVQTLAGKVTSCTESPPGVDFALPVLASCSASNAPNARARHSSLTTGLTQ